MIVLEYLLMFLLLLAGFFAVNYKEELVSIIFLSILSIALTALYLINQAPDVALAEAVIGTGLITAIFMAAISHVREGEDCIYREED